MGLVRLNDLSRNDARKIRARQIRGRMQVKFDDQNYICYDEDELNAWQSKKRGRKPKKTDSLGHATYTNL